MSNVVLEVKHMQITFKQYDKGFKQKEITAIKDLNLKVHANEMVAVIGASGSGKSLLAHAILGILPYNSSLSGEILYNNAPLTPKLKEKYRGKEIALVPQSVSYLDPLMKIGRQLEQSKKDSETKKKARDILARFGLADRTKDLYPFELSGGMARRVLISTAAMLRPNLVIADEPTPGIHISVAKRVLGHFKEMAQEGAGVLLITHDLELALEVCDRIVVFYAGQTIEEANIADFEREETLRHPYTKALWRAMPKNGFSATKGNQPYCEEVEGGCAYLPNCECATQNCTGEIPYVNVCDGFVKCVLYK